MIETDQQRRWWFATHPEFSSRRTGQRSKYLGEEDEDSGRPSPESVDTWVDERPKYETDNVIITLLKETKKWFGTEFQSKTPAEKHALLWEDEDSLRDSNASQRRIMLAGSVKTPDDYILDASRMGGGAGGSSSMSLRLPPVGGGGIAPVSPPRAPAAPAGGGSGPGKWVEVPRSLLGLEHQSKMSGQPIIERGGKYYINEYVVPSPTKTRPVYFDDFRDGIFYEYKGPQGNLLNKDKVFDPWFKGAKADRDQAWGQVEAARGIPVIWRVGPDQVKAFEKALGRIPGLSVEP